MIDNVFSLIFLLQSMAKVYGNLHCMKYCWHFKPIFIKGDLFAWHFWTNGSGSTTAYPFQFLAPDRTRVIPDSSLLGDVRSFMRNHIEVQQESF